uniref:Uncharacterized protein n=1 Tax=Romanomermis culicivorax TaxID=13658 RepID=A0A915JYE0_ROMCU
MLIYGVRLLYIYIYEPCHMISTVAYCKKLYTPVAVPLIGIPSTILALSIERLCASVYYKQYDGKKSMTLPAVLLSFVLVIIFLVIVPPSIMNHQSSKDFSPKICGGLIIQSWDDDFPFGVLVGITMEIISMSIFTYIHFSDTKKYRTSLNRAINRLNIRYQLMFNIQLNKALLPSNIVCLPCFTLANVCVFASSASTSFKSQTIYSNFIFVFINLFATFQPLMFFMFNKWFKVLLLADLDKFLSLVKIRPTSRRGQQTNSNKALDVAAERKQCDLQSIKYFDHLEKIWN